MKVEELKNYGKAYSDTMAENSRVLKKLFNKEGLRAVWRHLGLVGSLRVLLLVRRERKRLLGVNLTLVKQKGLTSDFLIRQIIDNTALFAAMTEITGKEKTLAIHREAIDKIAGPMNDIIEPPVNQFQQMDDTFKAYRDYLMAFFEAEKNAGIHDYEVIEDSDKAIAINVTYCAFCEIPRLCEIVEACETGCYSDEVFYPGYLEPLGIRFVRSKTLARGGDCCDFLWEKIQ
ncbi:MAG: L-2-amino-thiazoline-4-carboxylic acid hydrolase [Thermodesulfobacteriota bacterium]|nr:L-2-amino-thiazoline-4-carboxylic acid hydrolase [Thermodesulfobacteriota bacterium]